MYDPGQPELIDVIKCQCKAREKKCSTAACGYWKDHISCTPYCSCAWEEGCLKPYTNHVHGVIAEGVTDINDGDGDYYVDLDIKTLNIVFLMSFVLFFMSWNWNSELGSTTPKTIFVMYYTWFGVKIHFSLWQLAAILDLCKLSIRIY